MSKRKQYEFNDDRRHEEQIVKVLAERLNATAVKLTKHERLDYALYLRGEVEGVVEVKRRQGSGLRYPEWFIADQKWSFGAGISRKEEIHFFILFEWDEGVFAYRHRTDDKFRTEVAGRTKQTRDEYDVEPMIYIPRGRFKQLTENRVTH